jgi:hypothetical protein
MDREIEDELYDLRRDIRKLKDRLEALEPAEESRGCNCDPCSEETEAEAKTVDLLDQTVTLREVVEALGQANMKTEPLGQPSYKWLDAFHQYLGLD